MMDYDGSRDNGFWDGIPLELAEALIALWFFGIPAILIVLAFSLAVLLP